MFIVENPAMNKPRFIIAPFDNYISPGHLRKLSDRRQCNLVGMDHWR